jgi:hypothetical protein
VVLLVECQLNCAFFFFCGTGVWIQDFMVAKQMLDYLSHTPNPWTMNTWLHVGWPFLELRLKWTDTYILAHWLSRHEDNGYRFLPKASSIWFCFSDSRWLWFLSFQAWWFIFPSYLGKLIWGLCLHLILHKERLTQDQPGSQGLWSPDFPSNSEALGREGPASTGVLRWFKFKWEQEPNEP